VINGSLFPFLFYFPEEILHHLDGRIPDLTGSAGNLPQILLQVLVKVFPDIFPCLFQLLR